MSERTEFIEKLRLNGNADIKGREVVVLLTKTAKLFNREINAIERRLKLAEEEILTLKYL